MFDKKREKTAILISLFLGSIFMGGGMSKLFVEHKFPGFIGPVWLEERLASYGLGLYAQFIANSQALIGFMLFTLLFRTLGAVMLVPMLANILMVTISLQWPGTPYVLAIFLLMNIALLLIDLHRVAPLIGVGSPVIKPLGMRSVAVWCTGLAVFMASARASHVNVWLGYTLAISGILLGWFGYRIRRRQVQLQE